MPDSRQDVTTALKVFRHLRKLGLRKEPATAELLDFLMAIRAGDAPAPDRLDWDRWKGIAIACLVKTEDDRATAEAAFKDWSPDKDS